MGLEPDHQEVRQVLSLGGKRGYPTRSAHSCIKDSGLPREFSECGSDDISCYQ
jgi:hypothetical protein